MNKSQLFAEYILVKDNHSLRRWQNKMEPNKSVAQSGTFCFVLSRYY